MAVNSNTFNISLFNEHFGILPRPLNGSDVSTARRDFSESVQAALRSGLKSQDLQAILDTILDSEGGSKEVQ